MIKNYIVVAFRNFTRNKLFTTIHVLGLTIGISASLVIFLIVKFEISVDKFEPERHRIYRIVMDFSFQGTAGHSSAVPAPLAQAVMDEVTGVVATAPLMQFQGDALVDVKIPRTSQETSVVFKKQNNVVFTNPDYFAIIPFEWLVGSPAASLTDPFSVVLSESRARQYFPGELMAAIVGREVVYGDNIQTTVAGIVKDLNEATDFNAVEFISYATIARTSLQDNFMMTVWNDWMAYSQAYVKLASANNRTSVIDQLNVLLAKYNKDANKEEGNTMAFTLQPLDDVHFNINYTGFGQRTANKKTLYGLLIIAGFLLLLGCINFVNLSTAQAVMRAKEIGIRKTVGGIKKQLVIQFLCETFCVTLIGTVIAISITPMLLNVFADFIPPGVKFDILRDPQSIIFLFSLTVMVSLLAGWYPSLMLSRLRPILALKNMGYHGLGTRSGSLRKVLTVSQFMIAQFFIMAGFVVTKQIRFSNSHDLGFRKEAILSFTLPRDTVADHRQYLLGQINGMPGVEMTSAGFLPPAIQGGAFSDISFNNGKEEVKVLVQIRWGDENYLKLYNVEILAGRNIRTGNAVDELIINETYANTLGFSNPADAIGQELVIRGGSKYPIVGIMRDFHQSSFHQPIGPLVFRASDSGNFIHIALSPEVPAKTWRETISRIRDEYQKIYPTEEFSFNFFEESIAQFYKQEEQTAKLLNWAMGLSLLISCVGLLGLVVHTSQTRRKEIGIRKILGASVRGIVSILSVEFIQLVVLAFIISAPLAWWATTKWLTSYAYKTPITWTVFAGSGLLLIVVAMIFISFHTLSTARRNPVESLKDE
jgi:ABC-type antimicrobial peptide transport system permease subunit